MGPSPWNWREGPCRPHCGLLVPQWGAGSWSKLLQLCSPLPLSQRFSFINHQFCNNNFVNIRSVLVICMEIRKNLFDVGNYLHFSFPKDNSVIIQGTWGLWSDWSPCPALCDQVGIQLRSRNCQSRSTPCNGPRVEGKECRGSECPKICELELVWSPRQAYSHALSSHGV